jgi:cysteinyl-tRNA synthetase
MAELRLEARFRKDWIEADLLRNKILALGWNVLDTASGQMLEPKKIEK